MKSLTQHFRETSMEPDKSPRTFRMTLRDLIDSLEFFDDKDRMVDVFLDSPEADEIVRVKFVNDADGHQD
ncbi:MAG: hypothetical protein JW384_03209 [Nitrosomonadaceae bacterium]|nr:hypothetical protein [Nitrosomonadaceae bacterium]